ncbi:hypothetical protein ACQR1W_33815 [Bradyrhizobium sp. HKCCYLS1011]|uniref:hypothetical protein n=1 Tax=Bradyrhizobium sp. HKCCYLS1011 TaxID=3420733 RepID=UPI003EB95A35
MDVGTFEDLIDRLGHDLPRWPDAERCVGTLLLASLPKASSLFEQAKALRTALAAPVVRAPAGLAGQIIAVVRTLRSSPEGAETDAAAPAVNVTLPVVIGEQLRDPELRSSTTSSSHEEAGNRSRYQIEMNRRR